MTTVDELFVAAGVDWAGVVPWGTKVPLDSPGVYVVALGDDPKLESSFRPMPVDAEAVLELLRARPEATVDGQPTDPEGVARRLQRMWVPAQSAVYVGLAGISVQARVRQFYATRIGARAPHAGGWPVKMIDQSLAPLWVHFGRCSTPDRAEKAMLDRFMRGVTAEVAATLVDPSTPLPFANLVYPGGRRKRHGMANVKAPRSSRLSTVSKGAVADVASNVANLELTSGARRRATQNITEGDIRSGRIRVPAVSKDIFPATSARIVVRVGAETHEVSWNPRVEGDRERSGIVRMGKALMIRFSPGGATSRHRERWRVSDHLSVGLDV